MDSRTLIFAGKDVARWRYMAGCLAVGPNSAAVCLPSARPQLALSWPRFDDLLLLYYIVIILMNKAAVSDKHRAQGRHATMLLVAL